MPKCNELRIHQFLQHELSPGEQQELELHLETCHSCCDRLHDSVADARLWSEAGRLLPDQEDDLEPLTQVMARTNVCPKRSDADDPSASSVPAAVQNVLALLAPTDDPRMLGRIGNYEVAGVVGAGGMSVVLKALDSSLNRYVAIKVLAPHLATGSAARKRFAREAQAAAAIVHDNVIDIHGVDEAMGLPYLVMPYVKGESLQKRLNNEGSLAVKEVLRIATQTAAGLAAAHAQGLIHRDVKPANILLADGVERVTITDFGLARAADDASLTRTGTIAGTPQYMSPEQARGESVDQRSDLFSLGSLIYAMCTGRAPFRAESSYGVLRLVSDSHPRPINDINPELPTWLCRLVERLHAKDPRHRYPSAVAVAEDLEQCLAHVQQPSRERLPEGLTETHATRLVRQHWRLTASLVAASLFVVAALSVLAQKTAPPVVPDTTQERGAVDERSKTSVIVESETPADSPIENTTGSTNQSPQDAIWLDGTDAELQQIELETRWLEEQL